MTTAAAHRDSRSRLEQLWARVRARSSGLSIVTRTGWGLLAGVVLLLVAGPALGWSELTLAAVALVLTVVVALLLVIGGTTPDLDIDLAPQRLTPRRSSDLPDPQSTVTITVAAPAHRPQRAVTIDVPVGERVARFGIPALTAGHEHAVRLTVPGTRRGVVVIGPVTTIRSDPFGIARRVVGTADAVELFVHPRISPLPPLDAGLVRDLEGRSTTDPSDADLDFHTLRPYAPGDDRRHVHWLSSARSSALSGSTTLMTKTYTDTRRSHLGIVLDGRLAGYAGQEEAFETAVAAAASVAARACEDEIDVTVVASDESIDRRGLVRTLDGFARVAPGTADLAELSARLVALAPSTSIVLLVTGSDSPFTELRRAGALFPPNVRVVALRVLPGEASRTASLQGMTVLSLGDEADLARLVSAGGL